MSKRPITALPAVGQKNILSRSICVGWWFMICVFLSSIVGDAITFLNAQISSSERKMRVLMSEVGLCTLAALLSKLFLSTKIRGFL